MMPTMRVKRVAMTVAFLRFQLNLSIRLETMASSRETEEVRAAKATVTKKMIPTIWPAIPIASNTLGREMNMRLGPADMPSVPMKV